jgi:hypothetical protein
LIRLCFAYFGYWRAVGQYEGTEAVVLPVDQNAENGEYFPVYKYI